MGIVGNEQQIQSLKVIQQKLANVGLYHDKIDGLFGPGSLEAFRRVLGGNTQVNEVKSLRSEDVFHVLQTALVDLGRDISTTKSMTGIDGLWGERCDRAFNDVINEYLKSQNQIKGSEHFKFGSLSESRLKGLNPKLVNVIRRALELSSEDFGVREGLRTIEQQRENLRKGVSQTMNSKHLSGDAVDIYPTVLKKGWQTDVTIWLPMLNAVKQAADELGVKLRFGINWKNDPNLPITTKFIDAPHVELA